MKKMSSAKPTAVDATRRYGRGSGIPHPVDVHVGKQIRTRRLLLGMNQQTLANGLGLTFQQVQKYEGGANRVSASRLSAIAEFLNTPIAVFFGDAPTDDASLTSENPPLQAQMQDPGTIELIRLYYALPDLDVRRQFLNTIKAVAERYGC
jgi:transcriptional regulator with XRE-family HTH domain